MESVIGHLAVIKSASRLQVIGYIVGGGKEHPYFRPLKRWLQLIKDMAATSPAAPSRVNLPPRRKAARKLKLRMKKKKK